MGRTEAKIGELLKQPTVTPWELALVLRTSRNGAYDAIRRGEVEHFKVGKKIKIPTAPLRRKLGME